MKPLLIIGYGNDLRTDDALGPALARAAAAWRLPHLETVAAHQLTPELAERVSRARAVLFADAAAGSAAAAGVSLEPLAAGTAAGVRGHSAQPAELLALCQALFGPPPPAWLLAIPGEEFGFGESLSPGGARGLAAALESTRLWISRFDH